ncbi:hypothetical protein [Mangrovihabitans endophyticus]|uniref:ATP-grasp domain-containing protein n=1 Tax=Mangrovihabitans endophyticus TaxID=1751298 RepID=A0A8J3BUK9_9ACTN|nr:hypothetical protein [Mangrovihabitans endophyticus]GGK71543.1 ATP-grasp domain-containing protein [Mangrovihabitans endophyticus]
MTSAHSPSTTHVAATRETSRVALVTCTRMPDLHPDDQGLRAALRARGARVDAVSWDDPAVDWAGYDLAVLRSTWDYTQRRDEFVAWASRVPRLANPAPIVAWNTDKHYLRDLAAAGLPVTPTTFVEPGQRWTAPDSGVWVVKPAVSAGSLDTGRYEMPGASHAATAHVDRLTAAGRTVMVQPYLEAVDTVGETTVLCFPDATGALAYSHGVRKPAMLTGPDGGDPEPWARERIAACTPAPAELAVAERVLAAVPGGTGQLLYARVDLIPGPDGEPLLLELELTEPSLFFDHAPGAADRMADAVLARA